MTARLALLAILAALSLGGAASFLVSERRAEAQAAPAKLTTLYFGNKYCATCHAYEKVQEAELKLTSLAFTRGTEMQTWSKQDKHKDAMLALTSPRGKQMAKILGYDVAADRRCVRCHGVVVEDEKLAAPSFDEEERVTSGVSCVICHGAVQEWVDAHSGVAAKWIGLTREEKEARYGLRDLWDPARRAELCCSCHIGNREQGKVVTHEMYAAGHPPLPGIEVAAFCEAMPRHWETWPEKLKRLDDDVQRVEKNAKLTDKGRAQKLKELDNRKNVYRSSYHFDQNPPEYQQARLVVVSALVEFREALGLVAAEAEAGVKAQDDTNAWPELTVFACYACHHDLKSDSWRRKRGYAGAPGRPQLHFWPRALAPLSLEPLLQCNQAAGAKRQAELAQALKELDAVFNAQPFGDPAKVGQKATALVQWSNQVLEDLKTCNIDSAKAQRRLLQAVGQLAEKSLPDFDSARQYGWAFETLALHVEPALLEREEVRAALAELRSLLKLELPKGQVQIVPQFLPDTLRKLAEYEPDEFRKQMAILAGAVGKTK
jgi:hypothetical protein